MPWTEVINPADDKFHKRNDDPYWNESTYFCFRIPERNLQCLIYWHFRPNMNLAVGGPVLHDPSGDHIHECLLFAWDYCMAIPAGAEMFEFEYPNGFAVKTIELQKSYRVTYEAHNVKIDVTFTSEMEPYYTKLADNQAWTDWTKESPEDLSVGHYEHPGWVQGFVEIDGERLMVDKAPVMRDRSWGPRPLTSNMSPLRVAYSFAMASDSSSFHAKAISEVPYETDPIVGTTEKIVSGWHMQDGVRASLTSGTRRCVERGEDGRPLREVLEATDSLGRKFHAEGDVKTCLRWTGYTNNLTHLGITKWKYDDQEVWGENQDWFWFPQYRRLLKRLRSSR